MNKTIVGLATGNINCAIHIIRLSGKNSFNIIQKISKNKIIKKGYTSQFIKLFDSKKELLDEVIINKFVSPKSFTGEDTIEINCHGGIIIANKIIAELIKNGAIQAKNGEFSIMALMNNKLDLQNAQTINNLIHAKSEKALELTNKNHLISKKIDELSKKIFTLIGQAEVNIDYPEYDDVPAVDKKMFFKVCNEINKDISQLIINSQKYVTIYDGIKIGIIGEPNAGKSTLLNSILNNDKAIVSDVPGTTRDTVDGHIYLKNYLINFIDTAGLRKTTDKIEKFGIDKTKNIILNSNIVIYLIDAKNNKENKMILDLLKNKKYIVAYNKSDINKMVKDEVNICAKSNNIELLIDEIEKIITDEYSLDNNVFVQTQTQINTLKKSKNIIDEIIKNEKNDFYIDLILNDLHTLNTLINSLIYPENYEYDFLENLFKNFCVGK